MRPVWIIQLDLEAPQRLSAHVLSLHIKNVKKTVFQWHLFHHRDFYPFSGTLENLCTFALPVARRSGFSKSLGFFVGGACFEERRLVERTSGLNFISTSQNEHRRYCQEEQGLGTREPN